MKKVLFLAMILGGFLASAQGSFMQPQKGISTKAVDTVFRWDFSDSTKMPIGHGANHTVDKDSNDGDWVFIKDTFSSSYTQKKREVVYMYFIGGKYIGADAQGLPIHVSIPFAFTSPTNTNGYIVMSPVDNAKSTEFEGGKGEHGIYNTWVKLDTAIDTRSMTAVEVSFYQMINIFNSDKFYIDWSSDRDFSTFDSLALNVRGVDLNINLGSIGKKTFSLPYSAAGKEHLYLRFRYFVVDTAASSVTAGYFWLIDDLTVQAAPEKKLTTGAVSKGIYQSGVYHTIPQNLKIPSIRWSTYARSEGSIGATKAQGFVKNITTEDEALSALIDTMELAKVYPVIINDLDTTTQKLMSLYTEEEGEFQITSGINTKDTNLYNDTLMYKIISKSIAKPNKTVWAADNGQMNKSLSGRWTYGADGNGAIKESAALPAVLGYTLCVYYLLDSTQTSDVYANGVQIVLSPQLSSSYIGKYIAPLIFEDSISAETGNGYTIAKVSKILNHTIKASDVASTAGSSYTDIYPTVDMAINGFLMKPGTAYRVCYRNGSSGSYATVARDGVTSTTETSLYRPNFAPKVSVTTRATDKGNFYDITTTNSIPMIRLLVGPKRDTVVTGIETMEKTPFKILIYPNPAKYNTTVSYTLPVAANVTITLRDLSGRIVKTVSAGKQVGTIDYKLNVLDLTSGNYFVTITANGLSETKKLTVVH